MLFGDCHHGLLTPYELKLDANIFARNALQLTFYFKIVYTFYYADAKQSAL